MRNLLLIFGDQLNLDASAFDGFDPSKDKVFMAEVEEESKQVWSSKPRIAVFLSAMRHFREQLDERGWPYRYRALEDAENRGTLALELDAAIQEERPERLVMTAPGDWRVLQSIKAVVRSHLVPLEIRDDRYFFSTVREFSAYSGARSQIRMEYWYRALRKKHGILMEAGKPVGGQWNFDVANRCSFGKEGPNEQAKPPNFPPDPLTESVLALVKKRFSDHPGSLDDFGWPVTRDDALSALRSFVVHRLAHFGPYEDAMWLGQPWLYHSQLSVAMNLKLLSAQEVVKAVEDAYRDGSIPIASAEGFIRQVLGWREYVRGIYWTQMPAYLGLNALNATFDLPTFFWNAETPMNCLRECLGQSLSLGYAHHIQRLMVIGLYALLFGVRPAAVHEWFLAVYVDAVEWVELPNTLGMGQFGDGGYMASKPYVASGNYIHRMSNYCQGCPYDPSQRLGEKACPFTLLYWDFLIHHRERLSANPRMAMQLRNLEAIDARTREKIAVEAQIYREKILATQPFVAE